MARSGANLDPQGPYRNAVSTSLRYAMSDQSNDFSTPYQLDRLPEVPAFHRDARRDGRLSEGQLVYYGPQPSYYGIGEVKRINGSDIAVDFRGTGLFNVHEEIIEQRYLIGIPPEKMDEL